MEFDASSWESGVAPLAPGVADAATNADPRDAESASPSVHLRHAFTVDDVAGLHDGTATVIADDGVLVYLNGVELGRADVSADAAANRVVFAVPVELIRPGTNVVAAEVHETRLGSPDLGFDLSLTMPRG